MNKDWISIKMDTKGNLTTNPLLGKMSTGSSSLGLMSLSSSKFQPKLKYKYKAKRKIYLYIKIGWLKT